MPSPRSRHFQTSCITTLIADQGCPTPSRTRASSFPASTHARASTWTAFNRHFLPSQSSAHMQACHNRSWMSQSWSKSPSPSSTSYLTSFLIRLWTSLSKARQRTSFPTVPTAIRSYMPTKRANRRLWRRATSARRRLKLSTTTSLPSSARCHRCQRSLKMLSTTQFTPLLTACTTTLWTSTSTARRSKSQRRTSTNPPKSGCRRCSKTTTGGTSRAWSGALLRTS